jgi:hypothetical protein
MFSCSDIDRIAGMFMPVESHLNDSSVGFPVPDHSMVVIAGRIQHKPSGRLVAFLLEIRNPCGFHIEHPDFIFAIADVKFLKIDTEQTPPQYGSAMYLSTCSSSLLSQSKSVLAFLKTLLKLPKAILSKNFDGLVLSLAKNVRIDATTEPALEIKLDLVDPDKIKPFKLLYLVI